MLEKALKAINADNKDKKKDVLSPLLVLEILKEKPKLKFSVIKTYLLNRLQVQSQLIKKNNKEFDDNMKQVKIIKKSITELNTQAKNFTPKECKNCNSELALPIIVFMCGHVFHDSCVESDNGKRYCPLCVTSS